MVVLAIVVVAAFSVYGGDESKTKAQLDEMLALAAGTAAGLVRSQEDDEAVDDRRPGRFKQNCEVVAERYVLTPREAEVDVYKRQIMLFVLPFYHVTCVSVFAVLLVGAQMVIGQSNKAPDIVSCVNRYGVCLLYTSRCV